MGVNEGEKASSKCCLESKWSPCLRLWLVVVWACGETVLMPQVLCQAVEEGGYITQAITDLPAWTHHWQARRLLESSHFPLGHIAVHIKVKSKEEIKEGLPALLITRNNIFYCFSLKIICTLKTSFLFVFLIVWQFLAKYTIVGMFLSFRLSDTQKDTWCQLPVWQHSSRTFRSTCQSDLAGHQKMFCQRMRRGKEQHPPALDRTEKQEGFFFLS